MGERKPFKIDRNRADPRRMGFLVWRGSEWRFPGNKSKRQRVWKIKMHRPWRWQAYALNRDLRDE